MDSQFRLDVGDLKLGGRRVAPADSLPTRARPAPLAGAARVMGRKKVGRTLHSENHCSEGIGVTYRNDRNRERFRRLYLVSEDCEAVNF